MKKSIETLVQEYLEIIEDYMSKCCVAQLEVKSELSYSKHNDFCCKLNQALFSIDYKYNVSYVGSDLLIWKDVANSYVESNYCI